MVQRSSGINFSLLNICSSGLHISQCTLRADSGSQARICLFHLVSLNVEDQQKPAVTGCRVHATIRKRSLSTFNVFAVGVFPSQFQCNWYSTCYQPVFDEPWPGVGKCLILGILDITL